MIYEDLTSVLRLLKRYRVGGYGYTGIGREKSMTTMLLPRDFDLDNGVPAAIMIPAERRRSLALDPSDGSYTKA